MTRQSDIDPAHESGTPTRHRRRPTAPNIQGLAIAASRRMPPEFVCARCGQRRLDQSTDPVATAQKAYKHGWRTISPTPNTPAPRQTILCPACAVDADAAST